MKAHPATYNAVKILRKNGFQVRRIGARHGIYFSRSVETKQLKLIAAGISNAAQDAAK